jgi:myosin-1
VTYHINGFLEKNKDTLFKDLKSAMYQSTNPVIKDIFLDGKDAVGGVSKRPITTGAAFNTSLNELTGHLMSKNPHYVRCIKSNPRKEAFVFDIELCTHQVRYLGLLEK